MKPIRLMAALVAGLLLALAVPAAATPITWAFAGTISGVGDPNHQLDGSVVAGTPFSGTYTFESTMTDDLPNDLTVGLYTQPCPPTSVMVLNVGNYTIIGKSDEIRVENNAKDRYALSSRNMLSDPIGLDLIGIGMTDLYGQALNSDALLVIPPPPDLFSFGGGLSVYGVPSNDPLIGRLAFGGTLSSLIFIPEPLSFMLIAGGAFAFRCRRPSRHSHS
jgi:hypothetical protein